MVRRIKVASEKGSLVAFQKLVPLLLLQVSAMLYYCIKFKAIRIRLLNLTFWSICSNLLSLFVPIIFSTRVRANCHFCLVCAIQVQAK